MNTEYKIEVLTDHFQVLFGDSVQGPFVDTTTLWDSPGRVVSLSGVAELVGLGTVRYGGITRLTVRVTASPQVSLPGWEMMGRFEVNVPSGRLVFWGPELEDTDRAPAIELPSGRYKGIAFSQGTETVADEMAAEGPDEYFVTMWPSNTYDDSPPDF